MLVFIGVFVIDLVVHAVMILVLIVVLILVLIIIKDKHHDCHVKLPFGITLDFKQHDKK